MTISQHFTPLYRAELVAASKLPNHAERIAQIDLITSHMARDGYVRERKSDSRLHILQAQCDRFGPRQPYGVE